MSVDINVPFLFRNLGMKGLVWKKLELIQRSLFKFCTVSTFFQITVDN